MDVANIFFLENRLTKGDGAPPVAPKNIDTSDVSALTGETRDSKVKAYTVVESRKLSAQYLVTISNLQGKLDDNEGKVLEM